MGGDDWQKFAAVRALLAWQAAMPGSSLLFMGAEMAPWQEWNDAAELPWHLLQHAAHRGVHDALQTINAACDAWPALWRRDDEPGGFQWLDANDADHSLYAFVRWDTDGADAVVCIANFTPLVRGGYRVGLPWAGEWKVILDTDMAAFWGSGHRGAGAGVGGDTFNPDVVVGTLEIPYQTTRGVGPGRRRSDVDALARQHRATPPLTRRPTAARHSTFVARNLRTGAQFRCHKRGFTVTRPGISGASGCGARAGRARSGRRWRLRIDHRSTTGSPTTRST